MTHIEPDARPGVYYFGTGVVDLVHAYQGRGYRLRDIAAELGLGRYDDGLPRLVRLSVTRRELHCLSLRIETLAADMPAGFRIMCRDILRFAASVPGAEATAAELFFHATG